MLYTIMDVDAEERDITRAEFKDGHLKNPVKISRELEHAMANAKAVTGAITPALYHELRRTFGNGMQIGLGF